MALAASGETTQTPPPQKDPDEIHVQYLASAFEKADTRTVRIRDDATWVIECEETSEVRYETRIYEPTEADRDSSSKELKTDWEDNQISGYWHLRTKRPSWRTQLIAWQNALSLTRDLGATPDELPEIVITAADGPAYYGPSHDWSENSDGDYTLPQLTPDYHRGESITRRKVVEIQEDETRWVVVWNAPRADRVDSYTERWERVIDLMRAAIHEKGRTGTASNARNSPRVRPTSRKFMLDSGASQDIVGLERTRPGDTYKSQRPLRIETAMGLTQALLQTRVTLDSLRLVLEPYVLRNCPDIVSLGRLCTVHGFFLHVAGAGTGTCANRTRWS